MAKEKEILGLFDETGRRKSGVMEGLNYKTRKERQKYIDAGYIPVPKSEYVYYCDNLGGKNGTGYIRDSKTGKPVDAPAKVVTKKEKAQFLYNDCQGDLQQIDKQLMSAIAIGNDDLVADLRTERTERIKQYQADLKKLEGE